MEIETCTFQKFKLKERKEGKIELFQGSEMIHLNAFIFEEF